jgi:hypothetical protein
MKWWIATIALLLSSLGLAQDVTVVQINAKWNKANTAEDLRNLDNCEYVFGWLENQPHEIQSNVVSVPVVVVYKAGIPRMQYVAGINLQLGATFDEIQALVNALKEE